MIKLNTEYIIRFWEETNDGYKHLKEHTFVSENDLESFVKLMCVKDYLSFYKLSLSFTRQLKKMDSRD